jgi:two-component system, chemotaxis family, protein-glutamate methylesterase/glutaminase
MSLYKIIVIGASLGGLRALAALLGTLPAGMGLPLVVVQHRLAESAGLASFLQHYSALQVSEAEDKQCLNPGQVYLAPAGYHLLVDGSQLALSTDEPINHARPAIDVLFESAVDAFGLGTIGVILTGASADGAAGLAEIRRRGGLAIVQDPADAECAVMPQAALEQGGADRVLPLAAIGPALAELAGAAPLA